MSLFYYSVIMAHVASAYTADVVGRHRVDLLLHFMQSQQSMFHINNIQNIKVFDMQRLSWQQAAFRRIIQQIVYNIGIMIPRL